MHFAGRRVAGRCGKKKYFILVIAVQVMNYRWKICVQWIA
jgi:hypothetical protein